ncbi:MAG TPA: molybdopterin-synthase adenylyltransferase MoeB [Alphaproteobacteria bacterium]|nr:molybdopterin-synthase adenylyltransferase MoeB [Alphaproteobacteria bacterium]
MTISDQQLQRYARNIILEEVGEEGQEKLLGARVLVVGAGGLGAPVLLYLAAAGVGNLVVVDDDEVDITNLQRQIVHATDRLGMAKTESAARTLRALNPEVCVEARRLRLGAENVTALLEGCDLVVDGSDNFRTRYLLNDACYFARIPLVSAALLRFDGQIATFKAYQDGDHPCYRCLFPAPPPADFIPRCEEAGILGAVAGAVGSLQAVEALKELLGLGESLSGSLLLYDGLSATFRKLRVHRAADCALCGAAPSLTTLAHHHAAA